ncbi:MAG: hypothetical protein ABF968_13860 [Acetobacter sp.]
MARCVPAVSLAFITRTVEILETGELVALSSVDGCLPAITV